MNNKLPFNHEANNVSDDELFAASSFIIDMSTRERAYLILLGEGYNIKHLNRIEGIWATTATNEAARHKIMQYLKDQNLEDDKTLEKINTFINIRTHE